MPWNATEVQIAEPVCLKAVESFLAALGRRTFLSGTLGDPEEDEDIVFAARDRGKLVCVTWALRDTEGLTQCSDWESEDCSDSDGRDPGLERLIRHYAPTLEAIARTPEAARSLLTRLKT